MKIKLISKNQLHPFPWQNHLTVTVIFKFYNYWYNSPSLSWSKVTIPSLKISKRTLQIGTNAQHVLEIYS